MTDVPSGVAAWLAKDGAQSLIDRLRDDGHIVFAPVERDGTVLYDEIEHIDELPTARRDVQVAGSFRIEPGKENEIFGIAHGPGSLKAFHFAPREPLLRLERNDNEIRVDETLPEPARIAVIGARACDLAALDRQDRIFLHDRFRDTHYALRREFITIVAVECTRSVDTCFCTSMGTGPNVRSGFDVVLTELPEGFVARAGSERGERLLASIAAGAPPAGMIERASSAVDDCARNMRRNFDASGLRELLPARAEHPRWKEVAARCLSCGNCTMVCPTCFCHSVDDVTDIRGTSTERVRSWASCFSPDHARIHGANFRPTTRERYRQWLTHKFATWFDQFGTSGCVGCGRCITWCPTGIDPTEEIDALRIPVDGA